MCAYMYFVRVCACMNVFVYVCTCNFPATHIKVKVVNYVAGLYGRVDGGHHPKIKISPGLP